MTYEEYVKALDKIELTVAPSVVNLAKTVTRIGNPNHAAQTKATMDVFRAVREAIYLHLPVQMEVPDTAPKPPAPAPMPKKAEYLEIAEAIWGDCLPYDLKTRLTDVATFTRRAGGRLCSRQVIATVLEQYHRDCLMASARAAREKARERGE